ncbi:MAG: hypothetical protein LAT67_14540 [Balneolales bacterium]|nr:hypothetical protein [Balneolales bacterium]
MANPLIQQINAELENLQNELEQFKSTVAYLNDAKGHVYTAVQTVEQAEEQFKKKIEELKKTYDAFIKLTDSAGSLISKIETIDFPARLDRIEETVNKTIESLNETKTDTLRELKKASERIVEADFDGSFAKLESTIQSSVNSNKALAATIDKMKLPEKIDGFESNVKKKLESSFAMLEKNTRQIANETSKSIHDLNLPVRIDKLDSNIAGILSSIQNVQRRIESSESNIKDKLKDLQERHVMSTVAQNDKISAIQDMVTAFKKKQQTNIYITWAIIIIGVIILSI